MYPASRMEDGNPRYWGLSTRLVRPVPLATPDGVQLGAWHHLPESASTDGSEAGFDAALKAPGFVCLFFHGNGGHRGHRTDLYRTLSALGLHSVNIDYRGYGDSAGSPSEEGLTTDARTAWAWVTGRGVPPGRVVLYGESLGCAVAIRLAMELCEAGTPPAGMVLEAPFSSMTDAAANHYWFIPVRLIALDRWPSDRRIGKVTCPVLHFHGRRDWVVPFKLGKRLFEATPEASASGIEKRLVELPDAGHNNIRTDHADRHREELGAFFDVLRKGTAETPPSKNSGKPSEND
jgi:fermentation-respiration switch protein FrsA (DUF1100 family)